MSVLEAAACFFLFLCTYEFNEDAYLPACYRSLERMCEYV